MKNSIKIGSSKEVFGGRGILTKINNVVSTTKGKILLGTLGLTSLITPLSGCSRVSVEAGEEVVIVSKPYFIGHGGVQKESVKTGAIWTWASNDEVRVVIRPVQFEEKFDDIMTADNVPVDFSSFIKIKATDGQTPYLIEKFGVDWYKNNIRQIFITELRDAVAKYPMTSLTTRQDLLNQIQKKVLDEVRAFVKENKIPVEIQEIILGKITPPEKIVLQLAETAAQQQRSKTEIEKAKAEKERKTSEENRAIADRAYQDKMGMTPEQVIHLKNLETQLGVAKILADAKGNITVIIGGQGVQPVMNIGHK